MPVEVPSVFKIQTGFSFNLHILNVVQIFLKDIGVRMQIRVLDCGQVFERTVTTSGAPTARRPG